MDLAQLETFLAVVEERSFSRAAVRLHRSQPAVSQVIRKLESDLGEVLFERSSRDGSLTAAGELLHSYALNLLRLRDEAANALRQLRSLERGRLNLAANEYTCLYLLPVLDKFRQLCPQISVSVQRSLANRIPDELLKRTVEIGIVTFRPPSEDFRSIVVYADDVAFIVHPRHPLANRKAVSVRELGAENFIAHNVPSSLRSQVIDAFLRYKTPLNMGVELPTIESIKRFVAMGNGVALVPGLTVQREVQLGELVKIHVNELQFRRQLRLVSRRNASMSHAALAFAKVAHSYAAEHGPPFHYRVDRPS